LWARALMISAPHVKVFEPFLRVRAAFRIYEPFSATQVPAIFTQISFQTKYGSGPIFALYKA
jgi:hypothetical protein